MKIQVLIVTYKRVNSVIKAVVSVKNSSLPCNADIAIIDNSENEEVSFKLKKGLQGLCNAYIKNNQNLGFARAVNQGIKLALKKEVDYILLLNDDAFVDEKCIYCLISALEKDKRALLAGPTIFYARHPITVWSAGGYFNKYLGGVRIPLKNKTVDLDYLTSMNIKSVDFLTGCVLMLKRKAIEKIGFFDESLFFYGEDLDYSLRVKQKGYKLLYVPYAFAWHDIDIEKGRTNPFVMYNLAKNNIILRKKHFDSLYFSYYVLLHFGLYTPYKIFQILKGSKDLNSVKAWFKGSLEGLLNG